jgi:hypothetical protein
MVEQAETPQTPTSEAQSIPGRPYAPPTVAFVPLKLEERLLTIGYTAGICFVN